MPRLNRREFIRCAAAAGAAGWALPRQAADAATAPPNVLFIAVDDLRPLLGCYGVDWIKTPNIDRLAHDSVVFRHAYCQDAVCSPSRSSLLTGLRPDTTHIYDNSTHFRKWLPDVVTLPQHFKQSGYHTQAVGKIFHSCFDKAYVGRTLDDAPSWSAPSFFAPPQYYHTAEGMRVAREVFARHPQCGLAGGSGCIHNRLQPYAPEGSVDRSDAALDRWTEHFVQGLIAEAPDVPDTTAHDGIVAEKAVETLGELAKSGKPWFLAAGFMKPHSPYVAPKRYWNWYDRAALPLPSQEAPEDMPAVALLEQHDHAAYSGVSPSGPLPENEARLLIHGYAACVSFIDAQVGKLLDTLEALRLRHNTIVILWGDHGYHLGEQQRWGKQTCFETATRAPLLVRAPGVAGAVTGGLVELVDIYPSLCELAGLDAPQSLEGQSFAPLLRDPNRAWKRAAFSQFPMPVRLSLPEVKAQPGDCMGYSMRTERYRLTVWKHVLAPDQVQAVELYDYAEDPLERVNIAGRPQNAALVKQLRAQLEAGWRESRAS